MRHAAVAGPSADLDVVLVLVDDLPAEDRAPERGERVGVGAVDEDLGQRARHGDSFPSFARRAITCGSTRREVRGGVDEADVGERLREVAELAAARRVVLLGEQPDVVARARAGARTSRARRPSRPMSARLSASQNEQGRNAPSPAGSPSTAPVGLGLVAGDEAVVQQRALDRVDGADDARVVAGQEPDDRHHQHRGVELLGPVRLGERVELGVEALVADLRRGSRRGSRRQRVDRARRARSPRRCARRGRTRATPSPSSG